MPDGLASRMAVLAHIERDPAMVEQIKAITWEAWMIEASTPRTMKESVDLFRMGKAEINANPDGIDLGGPFLETLMLFGMLTREGQLDPTSSEFAQGVALYDAMLYATPAYAWITTESNTRLDQIAAGRRWLLLNLMATDLGLALHPVSQALQEYAEMAAIHAEIHGLLAAPGQTVQMLGRLGYGPMTPPTPRWLLETRLRDV